MFRAFSDVQTAEMLNLPRPRLEGGKPIVVACPMSEEQHALQQELVERYERLRSQKVDPRVDNALAITTDGRKLATDARMLSATAPDFPESKVNRLVENVVAIWNSTAADTRHADDLLPTWASIRRPGATRPTTRSSRSWSPTASRASRSPPSATPNPTPRNRPSSRRSGNGSVRVLIGSTQKMGTGTNVQKRLVALHHLDAPWKPAEVEQRDGRILRQGNENEEVAIYRYVTEGSFDAYMWQALETKARFIAPGHDRRQRRPPRRGHRRPGTLLRRGQGDRVGQPGRADARRGRRRIATAHPAQEEPPRRAIRRPPISHYVVEFIMWRPTSSPPLTRATSTWNAT